MPGTARPTGYGQLLENFTPATPLAATGGGPNQQIKSRQCQQQCRDEKGLNSSGHHGNPNHAKANDYQPEATFLDQFLATAFAFGHDLRFIIDNDLCQCIAGHRLTYIGELPGIARPTSAGCRAQPGLFSTTP